MYARIPTTRGRVSIKNRIGRLFDDNFLAHYTSKLLGLLASKVCSTAPVQRARVTYFYAPRTNITTATVYRERTERHRFFCVLLGFRVKSSAELSRDRSIINLRRSSDRLKKKLHLGVGNNEEQGRGTYAYL